MNDQPNPVMPNELPEERSGMLPLRSLQTLHDRIPNITACDMALRYLLRQEINKRLQVYYTAKAVEERMAKFNALPWWRKAWAGFAGI